MSLSGGQRQRLSLARALAKRSLPCCYSMTRSLLWTSQNTIITGLREGLDGLGGRYRTLLTAHRPSTVALADRVIRWLMAPWSLRYSC